METLEKDLFAITPPQRNTPRKQHNQGILVQGFAKTPKTRLETRLEEVRKLTLFDSTVLR